MTTYYNNIRGVTSKIDSLENIVEQISPTIVALVETKLEKTNKSLMKVFNNKDYEVAVRNEKKCNEMKRKKKGV